MKKDVLIPLHQDSKKGCENKEYCAGIFTQSMVARNGVWLGLSYRPGRLHKLAELVPWNRIVGFLKSLKIRALTFCANLESSLVSGLDVAGEERNLHLHIQNFVSDCTVLCSVVHPWHFIKSHKPVKWSFFLLFFLYCGSLVRIRGSVQLTYGSGFGSGSCSESCSFRQWPSRSHQKYFYIILQI